MHPVPATIGMRASGGDTVPVYEYFCKSCDDKFEVLAPMGRMTQVLDCPEGHLGARKVLSVFATVSTVPSSQAFDASSCSSESAGCGADNCCAM